MYDTPISLQEYCVDFICDNLAALCDVQTSENKHSKFVFKDSEVCFHTDLSEQLLAALCEKGKLSDETLALFDSQSTTLRRVSIHDAQLTLKGLRVLKTHRISELEITGLKDVTVNDVIGCLGEWTLCNLRILNVSNNTFLNSAKFCVVVALSKLRNLHSLNVSYTEFNKHGLEIIAEDLPYLESLDISSTPISDITPLRKCKDRLKSLSMYNLQFPCSVEAVTILCDLTHLRHLDVSGDALGQPFITVHPAQFQIKALLERTSGNPNLRSLDISGREEVPESLLREYMETHSALRFLGLSLTKACEYALFSVDSVEYNSEMTVTGEATLTQIMEALRRYSSRAVYVQKTLFKLFGFSSGFAEPREDIIKLVLPGMKSHPRQLGVQMAATACLYNLTKGELGPKIQPSCLLQVVGLTLDAMENFPNHQQLQKNALLTLCSDRILQDISFDRFRCAKLVVECLCSFDDSSMNRMSVAICSILAAKISTEQTSKLGSKPRYMRKLLQLVRSRMESGVIDITLKFTLSALWNLTDESPPTCNVFLSEQGLELFMNMLQALEVDNDNRVQVETKILGLLNNIAEVKSLRQDLMREDFIMVVKRLLHTKPIDVSYFAAGIIAHLASDGEEAWRGIAGMQRADILEELGQVVMAWEQPQGEMVAYRSFSPFFPLLDCFDTPSVQLWALWAIQHVCTRNGDRYLPLLQEEGGVEKIHQLMTTYAADSNLSQISANIHDKLNKHVRSRALLLCQDDERFNYQRNKAIIELSSSSSLLDTHK